MNEITRLHQMGKVARLHLPAGHDLFDGRKFENHSQNGSHGAMIPVRLIVEDEVLQFAPLNGHQHGTVGSGDGRNHALLASLQLDAGLAASTDAESAAQAERLIDARLSALGLVRITG